MKLRRKKDNPEIVPRRPRPDADERMSVSSTFKYSSRSSADALNTGRFEEDAKKKAREAQNGLKRRVILALVTLLILVVAFLLLRLSANPKIEPLDSGTQAVLTPQQKNLYQESAANFLAGSIRNKNKITVDSSGLSKYMLSKYPLLTSVNLSVGFFSGKPTVYIQIDRPALVLIENKDSYAVDIYGRVMYRLTPGELNTSSIPNVTDQSGLKATQGHLVLPSDNVSFIEMVFGQLQAKGYNISSLTLPAGSGELDARVAGQPYYVKFNLENNDPRQQAGTYLATIAQLKSQNITPAKYIDVRVDGRAYYQ